MRSAAHQDDHAVGANAPTTLAKMAWYRNHLREHHAHGLHDPSALGLTELERRHDVRHRDDGGGAAA